MLLDYHLPKGDGLQLCYRIKQQIPAPRVIIFSAYASPELRSRRAWPRAMRCSTRACRRASCSRRSAASQRREPRRRAVGAALHEAHARIAEEDRALIGMLLDGTPELEAARTLGLPSRTSGTPSSAP